MSEETGEFNLMEAAAELTGDSGAQGDSAQSSSAEGQSEANPSDNANEKTLSPEEVLKQLSEEKPEVDQALIDQINALGAIHDGLPIAVRSHDELKELIQKGFDYTKKNMARENEHRVKEEGFSQREAQNKEKETALAQKEQAIEQEMYVNTNFRSIFSKIQAEDPELFAHLDRLYRAEEQAYAKQMPFKSEIENLKKTYDEKFNQLAQGNQQKELGQIKEGWAKELADVQTKQAANLSKLGVKPDWKKVEAAWAADTSGKMSVEQALYAVHGSDIVKANESYQKLLATKNKTNAKILGRSGIGGAQKAPVTTKAQSYGDYDSILQQEVANLN